MKVKIIFLDIDGVLNNPGCYAKASGSHVPADPSCVAALNHITDFTGALIVISSTWRFMGLMPCKDHLTKWGVTGEVLGLTPSGRVSRRAARIENRPRGCEILDWLQSFDRYGVESFVILDDDDDMGILINRLVQTKGHIGLTMADAEKAVLMLNQQ